MKKRRKYWIAAVLLAASAGVGLPILLPRQKPQTVLAARSERLSELRAVVNGTGEIRTEDSVDIQAEIAGVIVELPLKEGDRVQKGQVLLRIDPFQTDSDVQAARSQLAALEAEAAGQDFQISSGEANAARDEFLRKSAQVELRQAETNLARTQESFQRESRLLAEKLISPDQFEVTETQLKLDRAQVEAATAKIDQIDAQVKATRANIDFVRATQKAMRQRVEGARSGLRRADDLLKRTTIRSPLDGVVVKLNVEVGERAVPGILSNPQATLMTIADFSVIEAELKVDETDIVNVEIGNPAKVVVDALPDTPLTGTVSEVGNSPILGSSSGGSGGMSGGGQEGKDFKVVLRIQSPLPSLRPGMSCEADIETAVRKDVLVIPLQALTVREVRVDAEGRYLPGPPDEKHGERGAAVADTPARRRKEMQGVFACGDGSLAIFRPVKTGITGETDIEVLDGLQEGEEVVVGPLKALRSLEDQSPIKVDRTKPFRRFLHRRDLPEEEN